MKKYTQVIHLGDIHIRNGNEENIRLNEYIYVFNNLEIEIKKLESIKNETALIIVCGDIFHNKNKLEPYAIKLWNKFIKIITSLAPVILICGNHDFRQETSDIPDLIQVLYETMSDTKYPCTYFNETGTFEYDNIEFGLVSIKDTLNSLNTCGLVEELPEFPQPKYNKEVTIALFHGTITQSALPNGQLMSAGKGYPLEWFKGYDIVMLGDNHKQQLNKSNWNMHWGYPGSLIQQDIGEPVKGHGYLLWDLETKTGTSHHIYNKYGRMKVRIADDDVQIRLDHTKYVSLKKNINLDWFPKNPYITIVGNIGDEIPVREAFQKHNITISDIRTTLVTGTELFEEKENKSINTIINDISNFNNPSKWLDYIRSTDVPLAVTVQELQWMNKPSNILMETISSTVSSELCESVNKIRTKIQTTIDHYEKEKIQTQNRRHSVTLKHMTWDWSFSYGQDNWFNFETMEGSIGLLNGPNASGKSAFIDTLCIGLFGEPSLNRQMNSSKKMTYHCIHNQRPNTRNAASSMHVNIIMQVNSILYEISRKFIMRQEKGECTVSSVDLYTINKETNEQSLKYSGSTLVNEWITEHIGTIEEVMKTSIVSQLDNHNFFYAKSDEQKRMIDHAVNLKELQSFSNIIHESLLGYNSIIKTLSTILQTTKEQNTFDNDISLDDNIEDREEEYKKLVEIVNRLEIDKDELASLAGDFITSPPTETLEYWQDVLVKATTIIEECYYIGDKQKLNDKKVLLIHLLDTLGETYQDEENIETMDDIAIQESDLYIILEKHKTTKPSSTRPMKVLEEQLIELRDWFSQYEELNKDISITKEKLTITKETIESLQVEYNEWLSKKELFQDKELIETNDNVERDWKEAIAHYEIIVDSYNKSLVRLNNHKAGYIKPVRLLENRKQWIKEYSKYNEASELCIQNDWTDIGECKSNLQQTREYISKKKQLVHEIETLNGQYDRLVRNLNSNATWKIEYYNWVALSGQFLKESSTKYEERVLQFQTMKNKYNELTHQLEQATASLKTLQGDKWMDEWKSWKAKEEQTIKHKWVDIDEIKQLISEYEDKCINHKLLTKQKEQLVKELEESLNHPFNPKCKACCANPLHVRRELIKKNLETITETLTSLGEYKGLDKYVIYYRKGLECLTFVEKHRNSFESKYTERMILDKKYNDIIKKNTSELANLSPIDIIESLLEEAIVLQEKYKHFKSNYDSENKRYTWLLELEADSVKIAKDLTKMKRRLDKMETEDSLNTTLSYWEKAVELCSYIDLHSNYIQNEKESWDEAERQWEIEATWKEKLDSYESECIDFESELNKSIVMAYKVWSNAGDSIQSEIASLEERYTYINNFLLYVNDKRVLLKNIESEIDFNKAFVEWECINNEIQNKLDILNCKRCKCELRIIETVLEKYTRYEVATNELNKAKQALVWYNYQRTKAELFEKNNKKHQLDITIEHYNRDAGRMNANNNIISQLHKYYTQWVQNRDILIKLDERLVGEKGKGATTDTFKEWVYANHVLPMIERQVNQYLSNIDDIRFRIGYGTKTLQYYVKDRTNETSYAASSGYQQFIIGLAMRQALAMIGGSGNNLQHMFIDEGFTACDVRNIEKTHSMLNILIEMGHYKSILLVSHLESIKDVVPLKINIQRNGAFTRLKYGEPYPIFKNTAIRRGRPSKSATTTKP